MLGTYKLPSSLALSQSCFGKRFQIELGDQRIVVATPTLRWRADDQPTVSAPDIADLATARVQDRLGGPDGYDEPWFWGGVESWNPRSRSVNASVSAVVLQTSVRAQELDYSDYLYGLGHPTGDAVERLFASVGLWFEALRTWVEVVVDQDTDPNDPIRLIDVSGDGLQLVTLEADGSVSLAARPSLINVYMQEVERVNLKTLRAILALVKAGARPTDAHLLIKDAFADYRRDRNRKAVIDAGAAVEVVLARLNQAGPRLAPSRGHATLGWYVGRPQIAALASVPANTMADLVRVRNNAIHQNLVPTAAQARTALSLARSIVRTGDPLPV